METVTCDLCGSSRSSLCYEMPDRRYFPDEFFQVVECSQCGLGYVNPRPSFEEMPKYYPPQYYEEECCQNQKHHLKRYATEANYLREKETRGGVRTLLDVGCANGDFPRFMMTRGWLVEGVEISRSIQPVNDFTVYSQPFPAIPVHRPTYDAITAWAVLEHVHSPMAYFQKASTVLRRHGLFVFLVTNFNSWASRRLFCEDLPRHLYFFTEKTVRRYLEVAGFSLERADYRGNIFRMPPANWLSFLIKTRVKKQCFTYQDLPLTRLEFIRINRLDPGVISTLKFAVADPVKAVERPFWPVIEAIQILRKTYPVTTFVARKL